MLSKYSRNLNQPDVFVFRLLILTRWYNCSTQKLIFNFSLTMLATVLSAVIITLLNSNWHRCSQLLSCSVGPCQTPPKSTHSGNIKYGGCFTKFAVETIARCQQLGGRPYILTSLEHVY